MKVFVAVPRTVGVIDTDVHLLTEREKQAQEEKMEALGELQALIDAGYEAVSLEDKHTAHGAYRVFGMERKTADITDLDPQTQTTAV